MPHIQRPPRRTTETTIELRGPSGRLYGRLDPERMILEVKYRKEEKEEIDLRALLKIKETA
jgi:hypothetical protein